MKNFKSNEPCVACGSTAENQVCYHHVMHRSQCGSNESHNLMPLCHAHHTMIHNLNKLNMASRFPGVKKWLLDNEWFIDESSGRWKRNKKEF